MNWFWLDAYSSQHPTYVFHQFYWLSCVAICFLWNGLWLILCVIPFYFPNKTRSYIFLKQIKKRVCARQMGFQWIIYFYIVPLLVNSGTWSSVCLGLKGWRWEWWLGFWSVGKEGWVNEKELKLWQSFLYVWRSIFGEKVQHIVISRIVWIWTMKALCGLVLSPASKRYLVNLDYISN